jgi:hypothetical protein
MPFPYGEGLSLMLKHKRRKKCLTAVCNNKVCNTTTSLNNAVNAPYLSTRVFDMSGQGARNRSSPSGLETGTEDLKARCAMGIMFPLQG